MSRYIKFESNSLDNYKNTFNEMKHEIDFGYFAPPDKKRVCVDIGSNMGGFIYRMAELDAFEEIYAFEPAFQTYQTSLAILGELNVLNSDRRIFNLAVADKSGQIYTLFDNADGYSGNASLSADINPNRDKSIQQQSENVLTISLDGIFDLLGLDYIDYLKMDCEGAELAVLGNSRNLDKIGAMMIECHTVDGVDLLPSVVSVLSNAGFHVNCFTGAPPPSQGQAKMSETEKLALAEPVLFAVDIKKHRKDYKGWWRRGIKDGEVVERVSMGDIEAETHYTGDTYGEAYERYQKGLKLTRNLKKEATN